MVTFKTNSYRDVQMFTSDAHTMLGLMGVRITVPSALKAEDVPAALDRLRNAIEHHEAELHEAEDAGDEDDDEEDVIPLKTRAFPLIELLSSAASANDYVIWE